MRQINTVVGVGGGTAIDIAKYMASMSDSTFVCIPAMLSTNAFATDKSALIQNGHKVTLQAKQADKIILDQDLITKAGAYNLYGLCDILSIHTALYDWRLADTAGIERVNPVIYRQSRKLLDSALRYAAVKQPARDDISLLFSLIGESGHITNIYGSGRPESGSEHIFAKELERRVDIPHGISIAVGITLMSYLQNNHSMDIQNALKHTGVLTDVVEAYDLRGAIVASLQSLLPRPDRYTILNQKLPAGHDSRRLTEMLYSEILGAMHAYSHR